MDKKYNSPDLIRIERNRYITGVVLFGCLGIYLLIFKDRPEGVFFIFGSLFSLACILYYTIKYRIAKTDEIKKTEKLTRRPNVIPKNNKYKNNTAKRPWIILVWTIVFILLILGCYLYFVMMPELAEKKYLLSNVETKKIEFIFNE